jgi:hypothetical protein
MTMAVIASGKKLKIMAISGIRVAIAQKIK